DRTRHAERGRVDRAERRRDEMIAPARRDLRLLRHERGEILIAELRRRQKEDQDGETEGGDLRPPRSVTRRDHTQLTQRYATLDDDADLLKIDSSAVADD